MERRAHKRGLKHMDTHGYNIMNHDDYVQLIKSIYTEYYTYIIYYVVIH